MADRKTTSLPGHSKSLAHQINSAISSSHTKINRLILDRMPKAVPPQTDNPSNYITGLLHFGAVYIAFESLWQDILGVHSETAPIPYVYPFTSDTSHHDGTPQITDRIRHILEAAYWPTMLRATRIKKDIHTMTGWPAHVIDEQIRSVGTSGRLGKVLLHTQESVNAKPHLLLAYAYCLYLALLSGGSYIRTELMYIKSDFWHATPTPVKPNMIECRKDSGPDQLKQRGSSLIDAPDTGLALHDSSIRLPLEFLDFDPPLGDNPRQQTRGLKAEFKRRFAEAEQALTDPERRDIVKESVNIFQNMEGVMTQLDKTCGTSQVKDHLQKTAQLQALSPRTTNLSSRLRDSIAIAKGRLLRTRRRSSGNSIATTIPIVAEDVATDLGAAESSKPPSSSSSSGEFRDTEKPIDLAGVDLPSHDSLLAHDAIIPGDGFRTVRYSSDLAPERSPNWRDTGGEKGALSHPHGFDGANADIECCPIFRSKNAVMKEASTQADSTDYALYAIISNFVVLVGIAMVFAAYLYVRRGDNLTTSAPLGL